MLKIVLEKNELELYGNESLSLTYTIGDISDFTKRAGSFSKTFTIPGSKNNLQVFQNYWEINSDSSFNPNKKLRATLEEDSLKIFDGYLQLTKVKRNLNNRTIDFEVVFYSDLNRFVKEITGKYLTDITSLSALTNTWNYTSITNSWDKDPQTGYIYPIIDYNRNYSYNSMSQSSEDKCIHIADTLPAVSLKYLFDGLTKDAGFSYDSEILKSERFTKLLLEINKLTRSDEFIKQNEYRVAALSDIFYNQLGYQYINSKFIFTDDQTLGYDLGNHYNTSTGEYTFSNYVRCTFTVLLDCLNMKGNSTVELWKNGTKIWDTGDIHNVTSNGSPANIPTFEGYTFTTPEFTFNAGDVIYFKWSAFSYVQFSLRKGSFFRMNISDQILPGDSIDFNQVVPKISQVSFFKEILTLYNLYVRNSNNSENNLELVTRDKFYQSGKLVDWSNKLDVSREISIKPLSELQARTINLTWKDSADFYNSFYKTKWSENYGTLSNIIENDFLAADSKQTIQSIFSVPINTAVQGSNSLNIPRLYSVDDSNEYEKSTGNRIFYYNGVRDCEPITFSENFIAYTIIRKYPFCSHLLGEKDNPSFSLTFDVPKQSYYQFSGNTNYPTANLGSEYYANTLEEYTSKASKQLVAYFHLTSADIAQLKFENQIFLDIDGGTYWKLISIENYIPGANGVCKVTLLLSLNLVPKAKLYRKNPIIITDTKGFSVNRQNIGNFNQVLSPGSSVIGSRNTVNEDASNNQIIGRFNEIKNNSESNLVTGYFQSLQGSNSSIIGGSGNTSSSIQSSIINSNDIIISYTGDTAYTSNAITVINSSGVTISGRTNIVILGLSGNTTLEYDNTTYTNELSIKGLTGLTTENIGVLPDGKLIRFASTGSTSSGDTFWKKSSGFASLVRVDGGGSTSTAEYSIIAAGTGSYLSADRSGILAGRNNTSFANSTGIVAGENNYMGSATNFSLIGAGNYNIIKTGLNYGSRNIIGAGTTNKIYDCSNSGILSGIGNKLYSASNSIIAGGYNNKISNINFPVTIQLYSPNIIGGGRTNYIYNSACSGIFSGQYNIIKANATTNFYSAILGGKENYIKGDYSYSSIAGGINNRIIDSQFSTILNGANNIILSGIGIAILGGVYLTGTTNYTTYADKLNLKSLIGSGTRMLITDSVGNISATTFSSGTGSTVINYNYTGSNINGLNTYTGGTSSAQTINISAATLSFVSASTVSASTIYSASTNIGNIFKSQNSFQSAYLPTSQYFTASTQSTITSFSISMQSGEVWKIDGTIIVSVSGASGCNFGMYGPAGLWSMTSLGNSTSSTSLRNNVYLNSGTTSNTLFTIANSPMPFTFSGSLSAATNGTFTIQVNSASAGQQTRIHSGATIFAYKLQ